MGIIGNILNRVFKNPEREKILKEVERSLYRADIGVKFAYIILDHIKRSKTLEEAREKIKRFLKEVVREGKLIIPQLKPGVILFTGINGTGKTTAIAKLGWYLKNRGYRIKFAAGDTYRAGAIEQIEYWGKKLDIPVIKKKQGSDPAAVVYDAIQSAKSEEDDFLIIDTSGRIHTKIPLMEELKKIYKVIKKNIEEEIEILLVLDATGGQNLFYQSRGFREALPITGIFLTKLDTSAKGGVILRISYEFAIPVKFIGFGEKVNDIKEFDKEEFINSLLEVEKK